MFAMELETQWKGLLFGVRKSIRYHQYRAAFYGRVNAFVKFVTLAGGTAAAASMASSMPTLATVGGVAVVLLTLGEMTLDCGGCAGNHRSLAKQFAEIERDMIGSEITPATFTLFTRQRLQVEIAEPSARNVLDLMCYNELVRAGGFSSKNLAQIPAWRQWLANLGDFGFVEKPSAELLPH